LTPGPLFAQRPELAGAPRGCGLPHDAEPRPGACQAIEDAVVLARCLREVGATAVALRRYERLRSARAAMVVRRSCRVGMVGQVENSLLCRLRDRVLVMISQRPQLRQLEEVVGHEV
jgi:2-polyprenyl-6-methoxyphenol hydroxylase-like FAD-dependent oxidoreductase